jgi:hypothetical protein
MLYSVFLHELGHLQEVRQTLSDPRRRYADERMAESSRLIGAAYSGRRGLDHPDPVHNRPSA